MKIGFLAIIGIAFFLLVCLVIAEPSFNGSAPGCSGSSCHTFNDNDINFTFAGNLDVEVTMTGVQSGRRVGGELVDMNGTVVDVVNSTNGNPFTLTAPGPGRYLINAGYKNPSRNWDSVTVDISLTSINPSYEPDGLTENFELSQNYPNPFNPSTAIEFFIPKTEFVTLRVYNILGEEVATLVSERLSAGKYRYEWDAGGLASGLYLYKVQAGDYAEAKKMLLVR